MTSVSVSESKRQKDIRAAAGAQLLTASAIIADMSDQLRRLAEELAAQADAINPPP